MDPVLIVNYLVHSESTPCKQLPLNILIFYIFFAHIVITHYNYRSFETHLL